MTEHYYSSNPDVESNPKTFHFTLKGNEFTFTSDAGVFSKDEIDFGSRLLIDTFIPPHVEGAFLDMGCGYGPIGLSLAKAFPDRPVDMVDVNERAVNLANLNREKNDINNATIFVSNMFTNISETKKYAAILTNPPIRAGKQVVHEIFEKSYDFLLEDGELWIVIQKKQGAPSAIDKLESLFSQVTTESKKKGYYIIKAKKIDV